MKVLKHKPQVLDLCFPALETTDISLSSSLIENNIFLLYITNSNSSQRDALDSLQRRELVVFCHLVTDCQIALARIYSVLIVQTRQKCTKRCTSAPFGAPTSNQIAVVHHSAPSAPIRKILRVTVKVNLLNGFNSVF